jgi:hypothetical protein
MSVTAERCDRIRDEVSLDQLFDALGWDLPERGKILCIWPEHDDRSPSMHVYRETNSVHCFSCGEGGDVVQVLWKAGNPEGAAWSLDDALDWAEEAFGLSRMTAASTLQSRLRKRLAPAHRTVQVPTSSRREFAANIQAAFQQAEAGATPDQLAAMGSMKDYIWSEAEQPGVDLMEWAAWARRIVFGSYAKTLHTLVFATPPPLVIDDRPATCRRAVLWELHRGLEYPSDLTLQLI